MSIEQIKLFVRRFDDMFNKPDIRIADEIFSPHFVAHVPFMPMLNRANFKGFIHNFYAAFPDFRQEINDTIMTDNRLVLRVTYYGTQQGCFLGIPATNREIVMPGISIFRLENEIVVENWAEIDIFGVLRQVSEETYSPISRRLSSAN